MSENTEPAPGAGLAPAVRRHWRIPSSLGWIALLAVLGMKFVVCQSAEIDCATAVKESNDAIIVIACQKEYLNTGNPQAGGWLAEAQYRSNNPAVASAVADGLLVSSARGIALRVLGKIANAEGRYELAEANLRRAQAVHLAEGDYHDLARDDQALISIQGNQYHYADALRSVDDCVQHAHAAHETLIEAYCHEAAVYPLAQRGATEIAEHELQLAERLLDERPNHDRELAWFEYEYASALRESPPPPLQPKYYTAQIAAFRKALQLAERSQQLTLVVGIDLSLAYSLIHAGALAEAAHYLDEADINDHTDVKHNDRLRLRAELALSRGDLATTRKICDELYGNPDFDDTIDQIEITLIAARAALAGGDLVSAEAWARRGIAEAHKIPAEQRDAELRAWTLSNYHEPYEMLFSVLARAGKLDEAVQAFDQWQGHMMFDALIRPEPPASFDLRQLAARIDSMHQSSPSLARNPMLSTEPGDVQIAQIRATELVALLVANGDLWRIASGAGQLEIRDLGPLGSAAEPDHQVAADCSEDSTTRDLHQLIEHFAAAPTNPTCASKLGELVLPDAVAHVSEVPLRVVLDAPLVDMPFAALRHAGTPLVKLRPIVRVPRLFEVGCVARARRPAPPVIVADADGN
ncbi:MAG TPA: hypothetical protein VFP84_23550, partial [Kofleriaceae bacterium]|nr:hypothetical protein [Kofleriaceae bacterium]